MKITYPNYNESILNVTNSILKYYNAPHHYPSLPEVDRFLEKGFNHIIYVLLDGLGVNAITHHLEEDDAIYKHMKRSITSVFPPTTVAATDAVLSGLPPIVNGHVGWVQYFKEENVNSVVFQNRDFYTGEIFTEDLREKYLHFTKIYDHIEAASPDVIAKEFFPAFREGGSESFEQQVERVLLSTHNTDKSFNYIYWIEPDLTEHIAGVYSDETKNVIKKLNQDFTELIDQITDDTAVILIADHGLIDVQQLPLFNHEEITSLLRQKPSIEPRATTFFVKDGMHDLFEKRFNEAFSEHFKLYRMNDFLKTNLLGTGSMHPNLKQCLGDFMSVATDIYMFSLHEGKGYLAHHAGLSEEEMLVPLVLYSKK